MIDHQNIWIIYKASRRNVTGMMINKWNYPKMDLIQLYIYTVHGWIIMIHPDYRHSGNQKLGIIFIRTSPINIIKGGF